MPLRKRIVWGEKNPLSDPRLTSLEAEIRHILRTGSPRPGRGRGGRVFDNDEGFLPAKEAGYYREYDLTSSGGGGRNALRLVVGRSGELYFTGSHYRDFMRIVDFPL